MMIVFYALIEKKDTDSKPLSLSSAKINYETKSESAESAPVESEMIHGQG